MIEEVNSISFIAFLSESNQIRQDGPSLESSSYLNVSLRYPSPLDPGTLGPLDLGTLGPWDSWTSSLLQHLLIIPLTSSYLLLSLPPTLLLWYGLVMGELWNLTMRLEMDLWPLYWFPGTSSFLLHSLPLISSHLLLIPPSYSILLPNLLLTPPTSSWRVSDD